MLDIQIVEMYLLSTCVAFYGQVDMVAVWTDT